VTQLLQLVVLLLVAASGLAVVLVRNPLRQAIVISLYGMLLAVLFLVFHAPDVALSITAVGALALPLMTLLALAKTRGEKE
jgi:energy-converting hydrogenase B subunit D